MRETFLENLSGILEDKYDIFITSSSFEDRSLCVTNSLISKVELKRKYVVAERNGKIDVQANVEKFTSYGFEVIESDKLDQLKTVDNFLDTFNKVLVDSTNSSFLIDITTFTRQNLLILVRLLRNNLLLKNNKVHCLYSVASDYSLGLEENEKWLSKGVLQVHSIFGYAGTMLPSKPYHLIILMGYETERAISLIDAYEPYKVTIGFASKDSSLSSSHYELNKSRYEALREYYPSAEHFEFSCSEESTIETILKQSDKYPECNVVISPMNNKISTLYLAAASFKNTSIQVAIALPLLYNVDGYSSPSNRCLFIDAGNLILK